MGWKMCHNCGKLTKNPKFCSRSCAAQVTGVGRRQHGKPPALCQQCGNRGWSYKSLYCSRACQKVFRTAQQDAKFLSGNFTGTAKVLRQTLFRIRGYSCERCSLTSWMGESIPLDV